MKVSAQSEEIAIPVNKYGLVPPLEQMAASFSFDVDVGGV